MILMKKSTLTLTQSGLLAVLLEHQRRKVVELARRRVRREHLHAFFQDTLRRPFRTLTAQAAADDSEKSLVGTVRRGT